VELDVIDDFLNQNRSAEAVFEYWGVL